MFILNKVITLYPTTNLAGHKDGTLKVGTIQPTGEGVELNPKNLKIKYKKD